MKKHLLILLVSLISSFAFCQTPAHSFESHITPSVQGFTQSQIDNFISKANFENYRQQDQRVTLTFDNGFEIVLLSGTEMVQRGLIISASSYPLASASHSKLPVFHLASTGSITAAYNALIEKHTK